MVWLYFDLNAAGVISERENCIGFTPSLYKQSIENINQLVSAIILLKDLSSNFFHGQG